ncbi:hypothetical protein FIBSPDRAFT_681170, partial [Athelia psychrophila]
WMKSQQNRRTGQKTAHLLLNFDVPQSVNLALRKGVYVMGNRSYTRKLTAEPLRCYKCQKLWTILQHLAANCPSTFIICRLCGEAHHTDKCPLRNEDPQKHFCINCKVHGHGASDKLCDKYVKLLVEMNKR